MQSLTASLGALRVTHWHQLSAPVAVAAPPRPASSRGALAVDAVISSADRRERRHLSLRKKVRRCLALSVSAFGRWQPQLRAKAPPGPSDGVVEAAGWVWLRAREGLSGTELPSTPTLSLCCSRLAADARLRRS